MSKDLTIAIDGHSSTGKSTIARQLAACLGYNYVDTGAMYRAVTLFALREKLFDDSLNKEELIARLDDIHLGFRHNVEKGISEIVLNGELVADEIREMAVSNRVSEIAAISEVREKLVASQKAMGRDGCVVMDGRDIGTVVFPGAELKIFMTASEPVRVERRLLELRDKNPAITREEVAANIAQRDLMDSSREDSPLRKADDARILDNSELSQDEQLEIVLNWVKELKARPEIAARD